MVILPDHDAVVAVYASTLLMQDELDLVWAHLLPAMAPTPLPAGDGDSRLAERLANLALPTAASGWASTAPSLPHRPGRRSRPSTSTGAASAPSARLSSTATSWCCTKTSACSALPLRAAWTTGAVDHIAASAAVDTAGRVVADLAFVETPHRLVVTLSPSAGTFTTTWASLPLTGIGVETHLATMHAPTDAA